MECEIEGNGDRAMDAVDWIEANVELKETTSAAFLYEHMASQSLRGLAVIYQPFDGTKRGHFVDRGQILDYAVSAGRGRVLDFGPGDGWPSLLLAPMADEVVGVDGSARRVEVCTGNAERLGVGNAFFVHVPPGERLPFEDGSFDAVVAASSIEQTPDPEAVLHELCRVLKPGGRLRMHYESLGFYRGGRERELWPNGADAPVQLIVFDRHVEEERARNYGLSLDLSRAEVEAVFARHGADVAYAALTPEVLGRLCEHLIEAAVWPTRHPSCRTWLRWLDEAGFGSARPTHDGGWFAGRLFDHLGESRRPVEMDKTDELLRPLVGVVVSMEAPPVAPAGEWDPWITAVK